MFDFVRIKALFVMKIVGAVISKSLSVVSSVIDSAVDLASSVILFWAWRMIKKRDKYRYPQGTLPIYTHTRTVSHSDLGRTRLEPIAIIILSVIMCAASVLVIYESINTIVGDAKYFTEKNSTRTLSEIDMSAFPIVVMIVTAASKAILFFLCRQVNTPTMSALAADHRNDVVSNIVALGCGLIGKEKRRVESKANEIFFQGHLHIEIKLIREQLLSIQLERLSSRFISLLPGFVKPKVNE